MFCLHVTVSLSSALLWLVFVGLKIGLNARPSPLSWSLVWTCQRMWPRPPSRGSALPSSPCCRTSPSLRATVLRAPGWLWWDTTPTPSTWSDSTTTAARSSWSKLCRTSPWRGRPTDATWGPPCALWPRMFSNASEQEYWWGRWRSSFLVVLHRMLKISSLQPWSTGPLTSSQQSSLWGTLLLLVEPWR